MNLSPSCKTILIVEDDAVIRETIQIALEMDGYKVFTAKNGEEGMSLLSTIERPCLILLDLMMPVMDGFEFIRRLEKDLKLATIPVVIVTAFDEKARGIHASGILKKPLSLVALTKTVAQWCN